MTLYHATPLEAYQFTDEGLLRDLTAGDRKHRPFSASSSGTWLHCAHSVLPPPMGRRPSGPAAQEGTAAHLLLSWILTHKMLGAKPPIPKQVQAGTYRLDVDRELLQIFAAQAPLWNDADQVWSEQTVTPFPSVSDQCGGTADLITWTEATETLHVIDFKYGRSFVDPHNNTQLLLYAMGAIRLLGQRPKLIRMSIWQPRIPIRAGERGPVLTWDIEPDRFKERITPLLVALQQAKKEPTQMLTGTWCRWCDHKPTCKAFQSRITELRQSAEGPAPPTPATLSQWGEWLPAIRNWLKQMETAVREALDQGVELESVKLVAGAGKRTWAVDTQILLERIQQTRPGIGLRDLYQLRSPAQIENLLGTGHREILQDLISRGPPARWLVPSSDPRPPISRAGEEFDVDSTTEEFQTHE